MNDRGHTVRTAIENEGETLYEELASSIIHGVGAVLAAAALALLIVLAAFTGSAMAITTSAIYGSILFLTFLFSAVYHGVWHQTTKAVFLALDHCAIFLLIAATYTPVTLVAFPKPLGWFSSGSSGEWRLSGSAYGFGSGACIGSWCPSLSPWAGRVSPGPGRSSRKWGRAGAWLLLSGGFAYTLGVVFFIWRSLPFNHAVWHFFVLGGAVCHFLAVAIYVLPKAMISA